MVPFAKGSRTGSAAKSTQVDSNILFEKFLPQRVLLWLKSPCCKSVRVAHEEAIVHVGSFFAFFEYSFTEKNLKLKM